jgi:hypothetical protein
MFIDNAGVKCLLECDAGIGAIDRSSLAPVFTSKPGTVRSDISTVKRRSGKLTAGLIPPLIVSRFEEVTTARRGRFLNATAFRG